MIYKDLFAQGDSQHCPASRAPEICLNCGFNWGGHHGWSCKHISGETFDTLPVNERYLTVSMKASLLLPIVALPPTTFKVGDRVRLKDSVKLHALFNGNREGVVVAVSSSLTVSCIRFYGFKGYCSPTDSHTYDNRDLELVSAVASTQSSHSQPAVNDFTCPHCKNTRCSKAETKCWMCGELLHEVRP